MTSIRSWIGRTNSFASVVRMAQPSVRARWKATYLVSVGLPVPPGPTAGAAEFAEPVGARRVQKAGVTARPVTLYLGDVRPGSALAYTLRPKHQVKAKAPAALAYEHYMPASRADPRLAQSAVEDKKSQRGDGWGDPHGRLSSARPCRQGPEWLSPRIKVRRAPRGRPRPPAARENNGPGDCTGHTPANASTARVNSFDTLERRRSC
jgi:hypothetical protein